MNVSPTVTPAARPRPRFLIPALLLLLAGLAWLAFWWKTRPSPAADAVERGKTLMGAKLFADAQAAFNEAIHRDPKYAPAYRHQAELAAANNRPDIAAHFWQEYVKREPNPRHAYCRLAYAKLMSGLEVPALKDAETELKRDPECAQAHLIAGVLYARKSAAKQALEHLAPAAAAYADDQRVQLTYGRVLALSGDYDKAEATLKNILTRDKGHAEPYYWLGYITARRPASPENDKQAEAYLRSALDLQPNDPQANLEMSRLYFRQGKHEQARKLNEKAVAAMKHYPPAYFQLAQIYAALGRKQDAARAQAIFQRQSALDAEERALLRRYSANPDDIETELALGKVLLKLEKPDTALLFLRHAAQQAPNDARIQAALQQAEQMAALRQGLPAPPPSDMPPSMQTGG